MFWRVTMAYPTTSAEGYGLRRTMSPQHGKHATPDDSSRVLLVPALVQFLTSQVVFSLCLSTASSQAVPNLRESRFSPFSVGLKALERRQREVTDAGGEGGLAGASNSWTHRSALARSYRSRRIPPWPPLSNAVAMLWLRQHSDFRPFDATGGPRQRTR